MSAATSRAATMVRPEAHGDPEARFRGLVQSPLRAGLLRFLSARPGESFEVESLMATFGRMRLDVENCLRELVEFGIVGRTGTGPSQYSAIRPESDTLNRLHEMVEEERTKAAGYYAKLMQLTRFLG